MDGEQERRREGELLNQHIILRNIARGGEPDLPSLEECRDTTRSLRKEWEVIDINTDGVLIKTPAGTFRFVEDINHKMVRLERIE